MSILTPRSAVPPGDPPLWFAANFAKQRLKPQEDAIYAAFGRFIASYSLAEAGLFVVARHFSGLPEEKARAIFAAMRRNDLTVRIRGLIQDDGKLHSFNELIARLELINNERDQFIHRELGFNALGGLVITNELTSRFMTPTPPKIFLKQNLEDMEADCQIIFGRLIVLCDRTEELKHVHDVSLLGLYAPWRYTPSEQENSNPEGRGSRKESRRRPRASHRSQPPPGPEKK